MKQIIGIIVTSFLSISNVSNAQVITFFFTPYPGYSTTDPVKKAGHLKRPEKIAKYRLPKVEPDNTIVNGIFSTYFGYLEASNVYGATTFPRKHAESSIILIITNRIIPITINANTVHHWELEPGVNAQAYLFEKETDDETQLTFWNVHAMPLPENNQIPLHALIIVAKPRHFYIPMGITLTDNNPNMVLPDIFVKKGVDIIANSLYILNFSYLFKNMQTSSKKSPSSFSIQPVS